MKVQQPSVGDVIQVPASKFLGTPATEAQVIAELSYGGQKVWVVREFVYGEGMVGDPWEVDSDGVCLIGPPLNGRLVRAG
jgi:hypothetical protein